MQQQEYLEDAIKQLKQKPVDHCVLWPFTRNKHRDGYGQVAYNGQHGRLVHRLAYQLYYDEEPTQMVLHKCGSHACFNPLHLYQGNAKQNTQDMIDDWGYAPCGRRKLCEQDVIEIIELLTQGLNQSEIATRFNVSRSAITFINTGRSWQHIPRDGKPPAQVRRSSRRAVILQYQGKEKSRPERVTKKKSRRKAKSTKPQPVKDIQLPKLSQQEMETMRQLRDHGFTYKELSTFFDATLLQIKGLLEA